MIKNFETFINESEEKTNYGFINSCIKYINHETNEPPKKLGIITSDEKMYRSLIGRFDKDKCVECIGSFCKNANLLYYTIKNYKDNMIALEMKSKSDDFNLDEHSISILKAAMDNIKDRIIHQPSGYNMTKKEEIKNIFVDPNVDKKTTFTGMFLFYTKIPLEKIPETIKKRCYII